MYRCIVMYSCFGLLEKIFLFFRYSNNEKQNPFSKNENVGFNYT